MSTGRGVRAPTANDFEAILALMQACAHVDDGEWETSADDVREVWTAPGFDLARDAWILEEEGSISGYAYGRLRDAGYRFQGDWFVRPDRRELGLGAHLLAAMEARGHEAGAAVLTTVVAHTDEPGRRLLESLGFEPVRYYWLMRIDLDGPIPESECPAGVSLRTARTGIDDREVHALVQGAFADIHNHVESPFEEWRHIMMEGEDFDPSMWFLAESDGEIVGAALCPRYETEGWVRQVAVRRDYRKRGIATALLRTAFAEFQRRGKPRAGLVVDSYNRSGAKSVYEGAGMRVDRQYDGYEKALR